MEDCVIVTRERHSASERRTVPWIEVKRRREDICARDQASYTRKDVTNKFQRYR